MSKKRSPDNEFKVFFLKRVVLPTHMTLEEGKGIHGKQKQNVTPTNKNYKKKQKQKSIAIYIDCQNFVYIKYLL